MNIRIHPWRQFSDLPGVFLVAVLAVYQWGCGRQQPETAAAAEVPPAPPKTTLLPLTNMVPIKAGTFMRIKFPVTITRDFWIGKYEVTQGEFMAIQGRNPSHFTGDSNRPVEKVTFLDAGAYCSAITQRERGAGRLPMGYEYRLPSEAEWEYAC